MCDEYDDERMRAFWRMLAERDGLVSLHVVEPEETEPIVKPVLLEPPSRTKPRALVR
ncbi:MAG TPA: hypothetical protein VI999_01875 [Thermoplasmata archaeon]|nr:hypothetical protein [Thermoplasmata archaeon]